MRRPSLLTECLASWRRNGGGRGRGTVPEPEGRPSRATVSRCGCLSKMGNSRRSGTLAPEHPGKNESRRGSIATFRSSKLQVPAKLHARAFAARATATRTASAPAMSSTTCPPRVDLIKLGEAGSSLSNSGRGLI